MIKIPVRLFFAVCIMFLSIITWAQPTGGGPGGGGDPDNPVPITGVEILIAAGAALGIRSLIKSKK